MATNLTTHTFLEWEQMLFIKWSFLLMRVRIFKILGSKTMFIHNINSYLTYTTTQPSILVYFTSHVLWLQHALIFKMKLKNAPMSIKKGLCIWLAMNLTMFFCNLCGKGDIVCHHTCQLSSCYLVLTYWVLTWATQ